MMVQFHTSIMESILLRRLVYAAATVKDAGGLQRDGDWLRSAVP